MPELPEVETVVRGIRPDLVGKTITSMWTDWPNSISTPTLEAFEAQVVGQQIQAVWRRAKYIVIELADAYLLVHLKMTGRLYVTPVTTQHDADRWVHVKFGLDTGEELRFSDSRKFGRVYLTPDLDAITGSLGPEPLEDDFTLDVMKARLAGRSKVIKALLLDQTFVAGIGNIYADEALFRAKIHPLRKSDSLRDEEISRLYETIRAALSDGIEHEGASINWYRKADGNKGNSQDHFYAYGREGQPCKVCGTAMSKIRVAQRGTHYCPTCQPRE
ncbi:MAG: formamidopyrimidine-DNA glycosylase [Anaerolineaceae bacterium]|nr:formamidopyrimidine-DNA glycosylase [Anaerolineaceae bacterium]